MIESLDETIKQLLIEKTPLNTEEVDISFEVPNREWSGSISKPTVNVYLHDIRENLELGQPDWYRERLKDGSVIEVQLGNRYDFSYLITAWTTNVEDEHRLLWYVLSTLVRFPVLPKEVLLDPLDTQRLPIQTKVAKADGILRNAADVWTALDNQLKPVLSFVTTLSLDARLVKSAREVRSRFLRFAPPDPENISALNRAPLKDQSYDEYLQIGGRVTDEEDQPVRAEVILLEQGLNVRTDSQGRFTFHGVVQRPKVTLLVTATGYVTGRREVTLPDSSYDFTLERETELVNS